MKRYNKIFKESESQDIALIDQAIDKVESLEFKLEVGVVVGEDVSKDLFSLKNVLKQLKVKEQAETLNLYDMSDDEREFKMADKRMRHH